MASNTTSTSGQAPSEMSSASKASKTPRVLSCVLCQQRKVKCNRLFPCSNCTKAGVQCVPSGLAPRPRRRRFAEKELLDRLRHYEDLLTRSKIKFEPMHGQRPDSKEDSESPEPMHDTPVDVGKLKLDETPKGKPSTDKEPPRVGAKSYWTAMKSSFRLADEDVASDGEEGGEDSDAPDEVRDAVFKRVWNRLFSSDDSYLMLAGKNNVDLHMFHPQPAHIFKLWQIYSENVAPLLKVTHTPTLQTELIDAVADMTNVRPTLEALLFGIYSTAVRSLDDAQCLTLFGAPKRDLCTNYQFGCQQALLNCSVLQTSDRECITALYLYLIAVRPVSDNRSLSATIGVAIRLAERIGLHSEASNAKFSALEAELRRRLWWSLITFDLRVTEMTGYASMILTPIWDCRRPSNVNDSDFRAEMKATPPTYDQPSESIFTVVRSEICDHLRNCRYHIDFVNPALKAVAKDLPCGPDPEDGELAYLEQMIEGKYLKFCNPENPLHFMTIWFARGFLAKNRLMESYSMLPKIPSQQTEAQRDRAVMQAIKMIEADTKLLTSPLCKGYFWLTAFQFPFPGYYHVIQDLARRPASKLADRSWQAINENYNARAVEEHEDRGQILFKMFNKPLNAAWKAREALPLQPGILRDMPQIVVDVQAYAAQLAFDSSTSASQTSGSPMSMNVDDVFMSMPFAFGGGVNMMPNIGSPIMADMGKSTIGTVIAPTGAGTFAQPGMGAQNLTGNDWTPSDNRSW